MATGDIEMSNTFAGGSAYVGGGFATPEAHNVCTACNSGVVGGHSASHAAVVTAGKAQSAEQAR